MNDESKELPNIEVAPRCRMSKLPVLEVSVEEWKRIMIALPANHRVSLNEEESPVPGYQNRLINSCNDDFSPWVNDYLCPNLIIYIGESSLRGRPT